MAERLPPLPETDLHILEDNTEGSRCDEGFIRLRRRTLSTRFPDGTMSKPFAYDEVRRSALDAVVVVPHFKDDKGVVNVYLRSALRPPVALRSPEVWPIPEKPTLGYLWEVPAGLVEVDERTEEGLRRCAARELAEEVGFDLPADAMLPLGPPTFPAPALIGERHFFFHCVVDPDARSAPIGDGSPLEVQAAVIATTLETALELTRLGEIEDAKTEIALRRLMEIVP